MVTAHQNITQHKQKYIVWVDVILAEHGQACDLKITWESNGSRLGWIKRSRKTRGRVGRKPSWVVGKQEPDSNLRASSREQTKGRRFKRFTLDAGRGRYSRRTLGSREGFSYTQDLLLEQQGVVISPFFTSTLWTFWRLKENAPTYSFRVCH